MDTNNKTLPLMSAAQGYASGVAISHWVYAAKNIGVDLESDLLESGILKPSDFEPLSRVSGKSYEQVVLSVLMASGDPLCGLHIGQQLLLARYGLAVHAILQSHTLEQALELLIRYQQLVGNMGLLSFVETSEHKCLRFQVLHENAILRHQVNDCIFAILLQALRLGTGSQTTAPLRIEFMARAPSANQLQEMERFFQCPLFFGMEQNLMFLPDTILATVLNPFEPPVALSLEDELARQLKSLLGQDSLLGQLKQQMRLLMQHSPPRRQQVADGLGMSVRTLDRRMAEEHIGWQELLDTTRAAMARELLMQTQLSMPEISQKLGFSDVRSFQRRFRHWTGTTPTDFRLTQHLPSDKPS